MIAIIAEKPTVAREIAKIVGATSREEGYIEGNNYIVTWALGHLIGLSMPENYGLKGFKRENLPIIPETFTLQPRQVKAEKGYKADPGALKQLRVIKKVFDRCDSIIVATDAGREGELIFRYIYSYLECNKPFRRLWISSLTEKAIREGLNNLKKGTDYDNLYYAAKSRSEADWLVGINASQALSITVGDGVYSLGRVQTPTLAMICSRYKENKQFIPQKYWQLGVGIEKDNISFKAQSKEKYSDKEEAEKRYRLLKANPTVEVKKVDKKAISEEAPLLFDLTGLQKKANSLFGFPAEKMLGIAQTLYEKKLISYPRTGSKYISEDVFEQVPETMKFIKAHPKYGEYTIGLLKDGLNRQAVNDKKVTDHHALLITDVFANELKKEERQVYDLIVCRMLEAFSPKCQKEQTTVSIVSNDMEFEAKGSVIIEAGWRAVQKKSGDKTEDKDENNKNNDVPNSLLPGLSENEKLQSTGCSLIEKQTKPKPLFTESSLLTAMENAGKELDDETQRQAMKDCGLGTPATRAAIIETLISRGYIIRKEKTLIPTEKGMAIYGIVKSMRIADVEMTGMWEETLAKIERGEDNAETFMKSIGVYTSQVTAELLSSNIVFKETSSNVCCPKCKEGNIRFYPMVARCSSEHCDFTCFRTKAGKTLTDAQLTELFEKKILGPLKGFKSKAGNDFEASMILDEELNVKFVFPERKNSSNTNYKKGKGKPKK
ncbi:type IA DNA topoisomerase [Prevotella sp. 10(H)]|uniref:type IA DNA topoisomerase n=1 Tax=Prevotella sp. 10(H) TaxID=1158294 RepID=UPI0004A7678D|nr:type IA DNA topoisomerase [Prevotella sp. 10(H)]